MRRSPLLSLAAASLLLSGCGAGGGGAPGPASSFLALRANLDDPDAYGLYLCGADGSHLRRASGPLGLLYGVDDHHFSPDRTRIAYTDDQEVGDEKDLYVLDLPSGAPQKLTGPHQAGQYVSTIRWSPDGSQLLIYGDLEGDATYALYVVSAAGGPPVPVSDPDDLVFYSSWGWSPDSTRLTYQASTVAAGVNGPLSVFTVKADGTGRTNVSGAMVAGGRVRPLQIGAGESPWSPDSSRIAFIADKEVDEKFELYTVKPDGTGLLKTIPATSASHDLWGFRWAPVGLRIAALMQASNYSAIWTAAPGVAALQVSEAGAFAYQYAWRPDGTSLAYTSNSIDLALAPALGGATKLLAHHAAAGDSIDAFTLAWAPDGSRIAYLAGDVDIIQDHRRVYSADPSLAAPAPILHSPQVVVGAGDATDFRWSPDSSRLLFRAAATATALADGRPELHLARADGSSSIVVSTAGLDGRYLAGYDWASDGTRYAFQQGNDYGLCTLFTANRDGGDVRVALDVTAPWAEVGWFTVR